MAITKVVDDGRSEDVICTNSRALNVIKLEQLMNEKFHVRNLRPPSLVHSGSDDEATYIDDSLVEVFDDASRGICSSAGGNGQAACIPGVVVD